MSERVSEATGWTNDTYIVGTSEYIWCVTVIHNVFYNKYDTEIINYNYNTYIKNYI